MVCTGINTFVRPRAGDHFTIGGWGSELSDLGGGYYIGRLALRRVLDGIDGRRPVTRSFTDGILKQIGLVSETQIAEWYEAIRRTTNWRAAVADLTKVVCTLSDAEDDICATEILVSGAQEMQVSLLAAFRRAADLFKDDETVRFGLAGGVALHSGIYQHAFLQITRCINDGYIEDWPRHLRVVPCVQKVHSLVGVIAFAISGDKTLPNSSVFNRIAKSASEKRLIFSSRLVGSFTDAVS
jgi:N-acetylglucosamine kinase-like BadF-type ATPase